MDITIKLSIWLTSYSVDELHYIFINVNVILRIIYVVDINVFHTLPLFKCKMWSSKARSCVHDWQIMQKAKLVAKKVT